MNSEILKKVVVCDVIDAATYGVADILNGEKFTLKIKGKMRMNYIRLDKGNVVYMVLPNGETKEGRAIFEKYICLGNTPSNLCLQKMEIDRLEKEMNA